MQKVFLLLVLAFAFAACERTPAKTTQHIPAYTAATTDGTALEATHVEVYKAPTCKCCDKWIAHLSRNGFSVTAKNVDHVEPIKDKHGLPKKLAACHTALVDGYVVEGHVPASTIRRMLKERPQIKGIAVPEMPVGSPGMEGANPEPYDVISFDAEGWTEVYEHVPVGR
jgi:hypothetical protein